MDPGGTAYYSMENYVDNRGNRFYLSPGTIASLGLPWTGDPTGFTPPPSWDYGAFFDASCNAAMIEFTKFEILTSLKRIIRDREDDNKIAEKYGLNSVTLMLNLTVPLDNKWYYHNPDDKGNGGGQQSDNKTSVEVQAGENIQLVNSSLGDKLSLKFYTSLTSNEQGNFKTTFFNGKLESTSFHIGGPFWTTFDMKGNLLSTFSLFGISISVPFSFSPSAGLSIDISKPFMDTNLSNGLEINFRAGGYSILGMGMIAAPEVTIPIMSRVGTLRNVTPIFTY